MSISSIYNYIVGIHPKIEVFFRKLYWTNIKKTVALRPRSRNQNLRSVDFDKIIENLRSRGIGSDSIIIVHSSYDILEGSGLTPEEINSKLIELVGTNGTLVMPVIRRYKEEGKLLDYLTTNLDDTICTYNVKRSQIVSGLLPYMLMQRPDSSISQFPLNPVVAIGKHAKKMMEKNLEGENPSPHGPNSSWKYCLDNKAVVIGLGVEMPHFLTISHVNEECSETWPIKNWFRKRKFEIIDGNIKIYKEVLERKPIWGAIYLAEKNYKKDLLKNGILKIEKVEGLNISIVQSQHLAPFLKKRTSKAYPYCIKTSLMD